MGAEETVYQQIDAGITSKFVGYDNLNLESTITVLTTETELTEELIAGQKGTILVEETPFYATMGGQIGDTGIITTASAEFEVEDTIKLQGGKIGHVGTVTKGIFRVKEKVELSVNTTQRAATCKNHSATHLLQKALRIVLGSHVEQAGSMVNEDRLRFDFTHFSALTSEELAKVEALVNEQIADSFRLIRTL
jgi:alanyl-tRNA synthetase